MRQFDPDSNPMTDDDIAIVTGLAAGIYFGLLLLGLFG